jgi:heme/copper-type cytochrome/quinol oxidase subunit 2
MFIRLRTLARPLLLGALVLIAAGCQNGQLVDAGDPNEHGQGGLAFVLMVLMIVIFVFSLFFIDRYRKARQDTDQDNE